MLETSHKNLFILTLFVLIINEKKREHHGQHPRQQKTLNK